MNTMGQGMLFKYRKCLATMVLGLGTVWFGVQPSWAVVLDEIQIQPDNFENAVRVQFNARIQFLRAVPVGETNSVLVYFRLVQSDGVKESTSIETLNSRAFEKLPGVTATLPPQTGKVKKLTLLVGKGKLPANLTVRAGTDGRSIVLVFGDKLKPRKAIAEDERYAVTLFTSSSRQALGSKVIPQTLQDYDVFTSQRAQAGGVVYELNLGYFANFEQAEKVRQTVLARFPDAVVTDLAKRRQDMLAAASAKSVPEAAEVIAQAPLPEVEDQAGALMPGARAAMETGNFEQAIAGFNQILLLPPNRYSQEAQELIGVARERNGETNKARAEYELYLKLFPEGEGAERVKRHLAQLQTVGPKAAAKPRRELPVIKSVTGNFSQFYYGGQSQTRTAFDTPTTPITSTLSSVDQSELRTNIDLTGRYRNSDADQKIVFRDDNVRSFIDTRPNRNRVLSAYYSYKGLDNGFNASVGRQTGTSGGVLGRFDGAQLGYYFAPKWRANVVAGMPVEFPSLGSDRVFWGASLDADELTERLRGKTYFIQQNVDGILDRRAVGMELGLYDQRGSVSMLIDYDVSYGALNIGTMQGNWQSEGGSLYSFLLERRRAPLLATSSALYNSAVTAMSPVPTSIKQLLQTETEDQIRQWAKDVSAVSDQLAVGFLTPLNPRWQVGGDFNLTNTGALPGQTLDDGTVLPPTPATGNIYTYSLRAIGSGLLTANDVHVFSLSLNQGNTYHGELLAYNNTTRHGRWTFEPSLKYYQQATDPNTDLSRWTPEIRVSYQWKDNLSMEADYTYEHATTTSPGTRDVSQQHFFYVGYRWDI